MPKPLVPFLAAYLVLAALVAPTALSAAQQDDTPNDGQAAPAAGQGGTAEAAAPQPSPPPPATPPPESAPREAQEAPPTAQGERSDKPVAFAASPGAVIIRDFSFAPATITAKVGETITWRNSGPSVHSATASDGSFDTGLLKKGQSGSHTFTKAGTFSYVCTPHPFMKASVTVVAPSAGGGGGGSTQSGSTAAAPAGGGPGSGSGSSPGGKAPTLPASGADAGLLALLGLGLAGTGLAARRRTAG